MNPLHSEPPTLEIACFNLESALIAVKAGADRIESVLDDGSLGICVCRLCQDYHLGGLSADTAILRRLKSQLAIPIPIYAMIRPHADHFYYEPSEFEVMKKTVVSLKSHGADGFVFGILKRCSENARDPTNSWIDVPRNKELVQIAGRPCTFHRAFDTIPESSWENALTDIMNCGFASILTNGGPSGTKATDCVDKLQRLVRWKEAQQHSQDNSQSIKVPEIIVGGGVRTSNLGLLYRSTGASAFHSAALVGSDETACEHEIFQMKLQIS